MATETGAQGGDMCSEVTEFNQEVIDALPDELVVLNLDGRIVMANRRVYERLGLTEEEVIGKPCYWVYHGTNARADSCPMKETLKDKKITTIEKEENRDGSKIFQSITTTPIYSRSGRITHVLHLARDITGKKESELALQRSRQRYRRLVKSAPLGIVSIDTDGNIKDSNPKLVSMLGSPSVKETRKINILKYPPLIKAGISEDFQHVLDSGRTIVKERAYTTKWGRDLTLYYHLSPLTDENGNIMGVQAIIEDIHGRKQQEKQIHAMNLRLTVLYETSVRLQGCETLPDICDTAIQAFRRLGYDRIRVYINRGDYLQGIKSSHLPDEQFRKVQLIPTRDRKSYTAIKKMEPVILRDPKGIYTDLLEKGDVIESASLPLISREKAIGTISIDNKYSSKPIKREDLNNLMTFANQVASAIEWIDLYRENQRKFRTLSALYDVTSALSGVLDLDKILNLIMLKIVKLIRADYCSILLVEGGSLVQQTACDLKNEIPEQVFKKLDEAASNGALEKNKAKYIENIPEDLGLEIGITSALSVPMSIEGSPVGVINVYSKSQRKFAPEELDILKSLSSQAAIIIENSKLYSTIKNDKETLTSLLDISQRINSTLDKRKMLEAILDKCVDFTNADFGFAMLVKDDFLEVRMSKGFHSQTDDLRLKIGEGISGHVAKTGKPVIVNDVSKDSRYVEISGGIQSIAVIPLNTQGKTIGVLNLESTKLSNFRRVSKSLHILTNQIAIAIENAGLYDKIKNFNERLKSEVEHATRELREKNLELQKMDQMKSDFVSNVSHELRTPMTSIAGYTKLLFLEKLGKMNDKQKQSLKIILEEGERLTRMINTVLDLSKLESGKVKFKLEKANIKAIAKESIDSLTMLAYEKGIKIVLKGRAEYAKVSKDLLKQVFINLLNNAIKFTPKGGQITVSLSNSGNHIEVQVMDTGEGIPADMLPKLFDKFFQVDSSMTRQHGGTGLGLVIVKHIIDSHKGNIWVESEIGKGSRFIFTLPA